MTDPEMIKKIDERVKQLENRFTERFDSPFIVSGRVNVYAGTDGESIQRELPAQPCFHAENGYYFLVTGLYGIQAFGECGAVVIEYADLEDGDDPSHFSEGDLYYMEDYNEEEMFQAMLKEIEH